MQMAVFLQTILCEYWVSQNAIYSFGIAIRRNGQNPLTGEIYGNIMVQKKAETKLISSKKGANLLACRI
jgi:hypothetical protein